MDEKCWDKRKSPADEEVGWVAPGHCGAAHGVLPSPGAAAEARTCV